jgi:hypothetical protein
MSNTQLGESSKETSKSLCHLCRSGICRSRRTRRRCDSQRFRRMKNQGYKIGRIFLCLREEFLHLLRTLSVRRANFLPFNFFAMRQSQGNCRLSTSPHRGSLQLKGRIFESIKCLDQLLEVTRRHIFLLLWEQSNIYAGKHMSSSLENIPNFLPVGI